LPTLADCNIIQHSVTTSYASMTETGFQSLRQGGRTLAVCDFSSILWSRASPLHRYPAKSHLSCTSIIE